MIHAEEIQSVPRHFMPEVFTLEAWDGLKPFVEDLEQREVQSEQDFRQWLADRNEVTVVFEEIARWKYIHTSLDTKDEVAKKEREFIIAEIRPNGHNTIIHSIKNSTTYRKDSRLRMRRVLIISTRYLPISKCFVTRMYRLGRKSN